MPFLCPFADADMAYPCAIGEMICVLTCDTIQMWLFDRCKYIHAAEERNGI